MKRLSIVHRLYLGFAFLCLVMLAWGLWNGWLMNRVSDRIGTITAQAFPLHRQVAVITAAVLRTGGQVLELAQLSSVAEVQRHHQKVERQLSQLGTDVTRLADMLATTPSAASLQENVGRLQTQLQRLASLAAGLQRRQSFRLEAAARIQDELSDLLIQGAEMKRQIREASLERAARDIYTADLVRTLMQRFSSVELLILNLVNTRDADQLADKVERIRFNSLNFNEDIAGLVQEVPALASLGDRKNQFLDAINSDGGIVGRYLAYRQNQAGSEAALEAVAQLISRIDKDLAGITAFGESAILHAGTQLAEEAQRSRALVWLLLPPVMLAALGVSLLLGRLISRPLRAAVDQLARMADGDFRSAVDIHGRGEFALLAQSMGRLLSSMQAVLRDLRLTADELLQLSRSNRDVAAGVRERLEAQTAELEGAASAMTQMESAVEEVAGSTDRSRQMAATIDRDVDRSQRLMQDNLQQVAALHSQMTAAAACVDRVAASSTDIGSIVQTIDAIADQTGLLALNAAIEAARAGEQGRSFAVVADEVRQLARRTCESTDTVRTLIESLQRGAGQAVEAMTQSRLQLNESRQLIEQASTAVDGIRDNATRIRRATDGVSGAMQEQKAVATAGARNINIISVAAQENFAHTQALARHGERLQQQVQQIEQLMSAFKV